MWCCRVARRRRVHLRRQVRGAALRTPPPAGSATVARVADGSAPGARAPCAPGRELHAEAHRRGHPVHGQRRPGHQRLPVLPVHRADGCAGRGCRQRLCSLLLAQSVSTAAWRPIIADTCAPATRLCVRATSVAGRQARRVWQGRQGHGGGEGHRARGQPERPHLHAGCHRRLRPAVVVRCRGVRSHAADAASLASALTHLCRRRATERLQSHVAQLPQHAVCCRLTRGHKRRSACAAAPHKRFALRQERVSKTRNLHHPRRGASRVCPRCARHVCERHARPVEGFGSAAGEQGYLAAVRAPRGLWADPLPFPSRPCNAAQAQQVAGPPSQRRVSSAAYSRAARARRTRVRPLRPAIMSTADEHKVSAGACTRCWRSWRSVARQAPRTNSCNRWASRALHARPVRAAHMAQKLLPQADVPGRRRCARRRWAMPRSALATSQLP